MSPLREYTRLRFYQKSQYWNRDIIERYQFQKVRDMLMHAGPNVSFYRDYLGEPMTFDIKLVDALEGRGTGKRPVIISRLK